MERRAYLGVAAAGLVLAGGRYATMLDGQAVPDGIDVATEHVVDDVLEGGLSTQQGPDEYPVHYYHLVPDEASASAALTEEASRKSFVQETEFDRSVLLVVQYMMSSEQWLTLEQIERIEDGLAVAVDTESPAGEYVQDEGVHSLMIRITDDKGTIPTELRVSVNSERIDV
ncbi:hypothetical protein Halru_2179 [Halovivax ruber XH-70]|uniref:Uncharacterized protein n=1 Tax=Halovivax ruber (strain DSM 18193 / JCM 13892 / XH-70) TaxID=797302 RepID=L0IEW9_HALRX|nr:hypothetical protein [Halovivax ruber]AGB16766.1 hypothetical protein Halru_2179 [Halovivax ruber XH-70]